MRRVPPAPAWASSATATSAMSKACTGRSEARSRAHRLSHRLTQGRHSPRHAQRALSQDRRDGSDLGVGAGGLDHGEAEDAGVGLLAVMRPYEDRGAGSGRSSRFRSAGSGRRTPAPPPGRLIVPSGRSPRGLPCRGPAGLGRAPARARAPAATRRTACSMHRQAPSSIMPSWRLWSARRSRPSPRSRPRKRRRSTANR